MGHGTSQGFGGAEANLHIEGRGETAPSSAIAALQRHVRWRAIASGTWFDELLADYVQRREARAVASAADPVREAERATLRACAEAALLGLASAVACTTAATVTADTEGLAGVVAIPGAVAVVTGDMVIRALIHLRLACDIAELHGARLDPHDPVDLAVLHAIAYQVDAIRDDVDRDRVARLGAPGGGVPDGAIGAKALVESVVRNLVPWVSLVSSPVMSWRTTRKLGELAGELARHRTVLDAAMAAVPAAHLDLLVEGLWFLFVADGELTWIETVLLARLLRTRPGDVRAALIERMSEDEAAWLGRLEAVPPRARGPLLRALESSAGDEEPPPPVRAVLMRAAEHLGQASG